MDLPLPLELEFLYDLRMSNEATQNRLAFSAEALPYFVRAILFGLSTLIYVPAAEQFTKLIQYVTSHLRFADGTTVAYGGSANDVKQPLLGITILVWANIILSAMFKDQLLHIGISIALAIASGYVGFQVIQAVVPHLTTSNGSRLNFAGTLEDYIKWQLMITGASVLPALVAYVMPQRGILAGLIAIAVALLALGLIAFVLVLYSKWIASKVAGGSRIADFNAEPIEMIGMMIGFVLFSMLIVTIPWSLLWYMKWMFSRYSLPARAAAAVNG